MTGRQSGRCGICGRELIDWRTCAPDDPAMDCGGHCWACVAEIEGRPAPVGASPHRTPNRGRSET